MEKTLSLCLNNKIINAHITNGAKKNGLFVAISEPIPPMDATKIVNSGVEQYANSKSTKHIKSLRKLKAPIFKMTSPPQRQAIIENKETISSVVSLFVKPRIITASKIVMQASINKTPSNNEEADRKGETPDKTSNTMFAT